jgi:hypothetical protein
MSRSENKFIIYRGYKVYEPMLFSGSYEEVGENGDSYLVTQSNFWNYWPSELSSSPTNGYSTKENYYKAKKREIDERISGGHWTDNFGPLIK